MKKVDFNEEELIIMALFSEKTREETIETLEDALDVLENMKEDREDKELIEILGSIIEKLQQIEDKYFYALELDSYLTDEEDDLDHD